jgi:hypothetical protein
MHVLASYTVPLHLHAHKTASVGRSLSKRHLNLKAAVQIVGAHLLQVPDNEMELVMLAGLDVLYATQRLDDCCIFSI